MENAFPEDILEPLEEVHPEILYLAPYDLFKLYFDEDVYSLITIESKRYAKQKLNHSFSLSVADLDVFKALCFLVATIPCHKNDHIGQMMKMSV